MSKLQRLLTWLSCAWSGGTVTTRVTAKYFVSEGVCKLPLHPLSDTFCYDVISWALRRVEDYRRSLDGQDSNFEVVFTARHCSQRCLDELEQTIQFAVERAAYRHNRSLSRIELFAHCQRVDRTTWVVRSCFDTQQAP